MPVKNAMPFLIECLDSIIAQTWENWELLAVNDLSTDASKSVLEDYANKDNRIKTWDNIGSGIIDALRTAYSHSSGDFISRMDADDRMSVNRLELMAKALIKNGEGFLAVGQVEYFSEGTLGNGYKRYAEWLNGLIRKGNCFDEIYKECVIPSPCWMVHRSDFELSKGFSPDRYPEDYDLCFRFYKLGLKPLPCDVILHHWRDYSYRTSRTDSNYADNSFIAIKCFYFYELNYDKNRPLVIWGAGTKGKELVKYFNSKGVSAHWLCNNPNKIGQNIYGIILEPEENIYKIDNPQIIIAIANPDDQEKIKIPIEKLKLKGMQDYFFFC